MLRRLAGHIQGNVVAYIALMFSVIGGGSYAIAATTHHQTTKKHHRRTMITACANRRTGELLLHRRCTRRERKVRWSIKGPRGRTGAPGAAGAPAPSIFAIVDGDTAVGGPQPVEKGMTVSHSGVGVYTITITDPTCASSGFNAPVVTPTSRYSTADPQPPAGATPVAFIQNNIGIGGQQPFTVQTGYTAGGSFTPDDLYFDVQDTCLPPTSTSAAGR